MQLEATDASKAGLCLLRELAERCCDANVDRRPDMEQVVDQIDRS